MTGLPRFEDALAYAARVHEHHTRKGPEGIPYVAHLLGVCALVLEDGGDEDEAIAALLHDAVEDQGGRPRLDEIRAQFGERVAAIVEGCTDAVDRTGLTSLERKRRVVRSLPAKNPSVLRVLLADKLHNARAMLRDHRRVGDELWTRFNVGREDQLAYYQQLVEAFRSTTQSPMVAELAETVALLAGNVETAPP